MLTNPKENRTRTDCILIDQFRLKGYHCQEIKEETSTILILKHERKHSEPVVQAINENYKNLLKEN